MKYITYLTKLQRTTRKQCWDDLIPSFANIVFWLYEKLTKSNSHAVLRRL